MSVGLQPSSEILAPIRRDHLKYSILTAVSGLMVILGLSIWDGGWGAVLEKERQGVRDLQSVLIKQGDIRCLDQTTDCKNRVVVRMSPDYTRWLEAATLLDKHERTPDPKVFTDCAAGLLVLSGFAGTLGFGAATISKHSEFEELKKTSRRQKRYFD